jgi:D-alanine-D-alanine ligase
MVKHVVVLMGGLSSEREVSIMSGNEVCNALNTLGYKVTKIDPGRHLYEQLKQVSPDVVFNALHGTYGEDGVIPGILEMMEIPYTHSGVLASALGLNKIMTKKIVASLGVLTPEYKVLNVEQILKMLSEGKELMAKPYVLKPVQQGSSVGVHLITSENESKISGILADDWVFGDQIMIERYIPGIEMGTTVLRGKAIGSLELRHNKQFFDYEAKYTDGVTEHIYPAEVPQDIYALSLKYAELAHNALGCKSVSRTDLIYDNTKNGDGKLYFLETNTHPGFTALSQVPDTAARNGIKFPQLVQMLIEDASYEVSCIKR